jgi:hypothetical protein
MACITQYGKSKRLMDKTERARKLKGCFDYTTKKYRLENISYNTYLTSSIVGYMGQYVSVTLAPALA